MKLLKSILLALGLAGATAGCAENIWHKVEPNALFVDVRTPAEYEQGHLPNAILIPHTQIEQRINELGDDKNRQIILYCRSGNRSGIALDIVQKQGYTNVINAGGYNQLINSKPESTH